jgi:hypothetical protein
MRRYLSTLHKRSHTHQKNFALAVSGGFSLLILAIWLLVRFGAVNPVVAEQAPHTTELGTVKEVGPLESLGDSLAASWTSIKESFSELTGSVDVRSGYDEMKAKTLDTYGQ